MEDKTTSFLARVSRETTFQSCGEGETRKKVAGFRRGERGREASEAQQIRRKIRDGVLFVSGERGTTPCLTQTEIDETLEEQKRVRGDDR